LETGTEALRWVGQRVRDVEGTALGTVAGLIVDRESGDPQWLLIARDRERHRCVPLRGILAGGCRVTIPWTRRVVERGPIVPPDGGLSARNERELCDVFEVPPTRGAHLSPWERRRSASNALPDPTAERGYAWDPPRRDGDTPRSGRQRTPDDRESHPHLPEGLRGRITPPPSR
jgi:hypothetical protein